MFSTQADNYIPICTIFAITSLIPAELEEPKIGLSGKGLTLYHTIPNFNQEGFGKHCRKRRKCW